MLNILKSIDSWLVEALPDFANLMLAIVGVIMSMPKLAEKIENRKVARVGVALTCIIVGTLGFATSVNERRQATLQMGSLITNVQTLVSNTNTLVTNTNTTVLMAPQVSALNAHVAELDQRIQAAKGDPQLVSSLEAEANSERTKARAANIALLLGLVPGIQTQLTELEGTIRRDEEPLAGDPRLSGYHSGAYQAAAAAIRSRYSQQIKSVMASVDIVGVQLYRALPPAYAADVEKKYGFKSMQQLVKSYAGGANIATEADLSVCRNYLGTLAEAVSKLESP